MTAVALSPKPATTRGSVPRFSESLHVAAGRAALALGTLKSPERRTDFEAVIRDARQAQIFLGAALEADTTSKLAPVAAKNALGNIAEAIENLPRYNGASGTQYSRSIYSLENGIAWLNAATMFDSIQQ